MNKTQAQYWEIKIARNYELISQFLREISFRGLKLFLTLYIHFFKRRWLFLLRSRQWWGIRMLLPMAILLRVWSINYVQLPLGQIPILWSEERSNVTQQFWNGKYHWKFLCYCTFVKSLFFYSKMEICFLKAPLCRLKIIPFSCQQRSCRSSWQMSCPSVTKNNEEKN